MATIYPINGYPQQGASGGYTPQNPLPGGYPQQGVPGSQGYYPPSNAAYPPGSYADAHATPVQPFGSPPYAQPPGGTYPQPYPAPQAYPPSPQYAQPPQYNYQQLMASNPPNTYGAPLAQYPQSTGLAYPPGVGAAPIYQPVQQVPIATSYEAKPPGDPSSNFTMREWRSGLCSCCEHCIPNFFMPWCCPCVSLAQIYARLGLASYQVALIRFFILIASGAVVRFIPITSARRAVTSTSNRQPLSGTAWYLFLAAQQIVLIAAIAIARRRVRQRFKIPGNRVMDALVSCFCPCCTIAQMATQTQSYRAGSCDFTGPDVLPAFL